MENFYNEMSKNSLSDDGLCVFTYREGDSEATLVGCDGYPVATVDCDDVADFGFHMRCIKDEYEDYSGMDLDLSMSVDDGVSIATLKRIAS